MKNLMTSVACVTLLLAFSVQFTQGQVLYGKLIAADQAVNTFCQQVKAEGYISVSNAYSLKKILSQVFSCKAEDVFITGDREPVPKGEEISYEVSVKVQPVIALAKFWNIQEDDNSFVYRVCRVTVSECSGEAA